MAFALKLAHLNKGEIRDRVERAAGILQIGELLDRKPKALSGGQRQRVAIGRAIVREPKVFLFDEPLSNLDAALRVQMRLEITQLHQALKTTMIYVTHDQVEAMTMADKIVVLNAGKIEQVGAPLDLYNNPANLFVAGFIGSPKMNLLKAKGGGAATIGVRPEHIDVSRQSGEWHGTVRIAEHLGSDTFFHIDVDDLGAVTARTTGEFGVKAGDAVWLTPKPDRIHRFDEAGMALRR
jgi:multiple sugar transport system ATP-binding protein